MSAYCSVCGGYLWHPALVHTDRGHVAMCQGCHLEKADRLALLTRTGWAVLCPACFDAYQKAGLVVVDGGEWPLNTGGERT